jgi:hypothetical protein
VTTIETPKGTAVGHSLTYLRSFQPNHRFKTEHERSDQRGLLYETPLSSYLFKAKAWVRPIHVGTKSLLLFQRCSSYAIVLMLKEQWSSFAIVRRA